MKFFVKLYCIILIPKRIPSTTLHLLTSHVYSSNVQLDLGVILKELQQEK
jgi:hypothetical protein